MLGGTFPTVCKELELGRSQSCLQISWASAQHLQHHTNNTNALEILTALFSWRGQCTAPLLSQWMLQKAIISLMTDISLCQTVFNGSPHILGYLHFPYLPRKNNFRSVWCCPTEISHSRGKRKEYFACPSPGEIPATSPGDLLSWIVKSMLQPAVKTPCKTAKNSAFIFSYTYCCQLGQIHWSQSSLI